MARTADHSPPLPAALAATLRRRLLRWYTRQHRRLPWRAAPEGGRQADADPYRVLVSEAMLQQTQVATVVPYYERFLAALPDVAALAAADEQRVLRLWQGLGYYRRARQLKAAAEAVLRDHGGRVPLDAEALRGLPGVGRYTAGAVASIAGRRREPVVDGNVARVLARWLLVEDAIDKPAVTERLWRAAGQLVPPSRPGDFNQALMELGALVCTPRQPRCLVCPVADQCAAREAGREAELPRRTPRREPRPVRHDVVALARRGSWLFEQRPASGLWARMWQLPTHEAEPGADAPDAAALLAWCQQRTGLRAEALRRVGEFRHQTTHRTITFTVWQSDATGGRLRSGAGAWRRPDGVDDLPLAKPQATAIEMARGEG